MHKFYRLTFFTVILLLWAGQALAGWQIITSKSMLRNGHGSTNLITLNIQEKKMRMDVGAFSSVIVSSDEQGAIQLFHRNKTFLWQMTETNVPSVKASSLPSPIETNFDGYSASLYCFSNQPGGQKRVWVAPLDHFVKTKSGTNNFPGLTTTVGLSESQLPGTMFGTNFVVAGTESTMVMPLTTPAVLNFNHSTAAVTDAVYTVCSRLISITETNFPASEFEVPKDYQEGNGAFEGDKIDPTKFIPPPPASGNLAGLRHQFQSGKLNLLPPRFSTPVMSGAPKTSVEKH